MHTSGFAFSSPPLEADSSEMAEVTDGSSLSPRIALGEEHPGELLDSHQTVMCVGNTCVEPLRFQNLFVKVAEHDTVLTKTEHKGKRSEKTSLEK